MKSKDITLIVIVIIVILVLCFFIRRIMASSNSSSEKTCNSDSDCSGRCQAGKCVDCSFNSDCCSGEVCRDGACVAGPVPPMIQDECGRQGTFFFTDSSSDLLIANQDSIERDYPIDWPTLTFSNIQAYATVNTPGVLECDNTVFGVSDSPLILDPVVTEPNIATFTGSGILAGNTFTFTATHNNAGIVTFTWIATTPLTSADITLMVRFNVQVADVQGNLSNVATFNFINGYNP